MEDDDSGAWTKGLFPFSSLSFRKAEDGLTCLFSVSLEASGVVGGKEGDRWPTHVYAHALARV